MNTRLSTKETFLKELLLIACFISVLSGCGQYSETFDEQLVTETRELLPSSTVTSIPVPTQTQTITVTPNHIELLPENMGLPVAFTGDYSISGKMGYAPCYHWDPSGFVPRQVTEENWYEFFHAGDMYILNTSETPISITILSPISGMIESIQDMGDNGLMMNISTDYYYQNKKVFLGIGHLDGLFMGDSLYPKITVRSKVEKGQPIGFSTQPKFWGRAEQSLDIGLQNGPEGASPLYENFAPDSYIDPYLFISDDIITNAQYIYFDYFRTHCLKSGHFPE